jgi:hypothetical protein
LTLAAEVRMVRLSLHLLIGIIAGLPALQAQTQTQTEPEARVIESIVPWLDQTPSCGSTVTLQNLGKRAVAAEVEAHKSSGALAPLAGPSGIQVRLAAGERADYKLPLAEDSGGVWIRVREEIPSQRLGPVVAVSGLTECVAGDELRSTARELVWPARNPWFSGDVGDTGDGIMAVINAAERPARVWGCYSSGVLYAVPRDDQPAAGLTPVCSENIDELIPPFGSRRFPVVSHGNSHFSLNTRGEAIVLQMLRPAGTNVKVYRVDSTVTFGKEVPR